MRFATIAAAVTLAAGSAQAASNHSIITTPAHLATPPAVTSSHPGPLYPTGGNGTNGTASMTKPSLTATKDSGASTTGPSAAASSTGAANQAMAASGAGLAALFGFAAYVL